MFRLHDGTLRFENLQFLLRPGNSEFRTQTIVSLAGAGQVAFQECLVTLDESADIQLSAVSLPEGEGAWRSTERRSAPTIRFDTCFVRGKGDLLSSRSARRFDLQVDDTLIGLDGSLANLAGSTKEPPATMPSQLRLHRVTAALGDHLVALRLGREDDRQSAAIPAAVQIACDGCLLAATAGRAFVRLEGADSDEQVRQLVSWSTPADAKPTYYANAGPALLEVAPANPERMPQPGPYDRERWLAFTHERTADPFVRMKFAAAQPAVSRPSDYRPRWLDANAPPAAEDCGAPIDRLPASASDEAIHPPSTTN
jgi:hypothetical protein